MNERFIDNPTRLAALSEVALEQLGNDHECTRALWAARKSGDPNSLDIADQKVQGLPSHQKASMLQGAKSRLKAESDTNHFLMRRAGIIDDVPPDRTLN